MLADACWPRLCARAQAQYESDVVAYEAAHGVHIDSGGARSPACAHGRFGLLTEPVAEKGQHGRRR
eukprot:6207909-Pleurochrysis_carterae.AAC.1